MTTAPTFRDVADGDQMPREVFGPMGQLDPVALLEWFCPGIGRERAVRIAEIGVREMTPTSVDRTRALILDNWEALPVTPADPTRLDPPIPFELAVDLNPHRLPACEGARLLLHLAALHGHPEGVPLSAQPPRALVEATFALARGARVRLLLTHLDAEGRPTFELAPTP